jgi:hypothetical protein
MSQPIAPQHPAVVLRSHYMHLKALLAIAMIAVVALAVTVVILANTENTPSSPARAGIQLSSPAQPASRRSDGGPEEGTAGPFAPAASTIRYDGGPEEGTRGPGH